jgi:hypothetical protein
VWRLLHTNHGWPVTAKLFEKPTGALSIHKHVQGLLRIPPGEFVKEGGFQGIGTLTSGRGSPRGCASEPNEEEGNYSDADISAHELRLRPAGRFRQAGPGMSIC